MGCRIDNQGLHVVDMPAPRDLKAWHLARDLAIACAKAADSFPATERFALALQLRRAGYSVALNIAEGASRFGVKEFRRFLDIARASLDEIDMIIDIAIGCGYLTTEDAVRLEAMRAETGRVVYGLLRFVNRRQGDSRPPRTRAA